MTISTGIAIRHVCALLVIVILGSARMPAHASPIEPDGVPFTTRYEYDPAFAGNGRFVDHFAGSNGSDYIGRRLARFANGDVVVAGLATRAGMSAPDQIGLVRYSSSGQRLTWASANPAYAEYSSQYLVYPKGNSGQPIGSFTEVVGIEIHNDNIIVLANFRTLLNEVRPIFVVFSSSGVHRGWWTYYPGANTPARGFIIQQSGTLAFRVIVLGDDPTPGDVPSRPRIWLARLTIASNGALALDNAFGSGGFAFARANACTLVGGPSACATTAAAIAPVPGPLLPSNPKFYVAVAARGSGQPDFDGVVMRFNGNGSKDTTFATTPAGGDSAVIAFDDGGDNADVPVALVTGYHVEVPLAYVDDIFVAATVARSRQRGIGIARFDESGQPASGFGTGGKLLFGGCGTGTGNCNFANVETVASSMVKDGDHLALAGWYRADLGGGNSFTDPLLAVVDADTASVLSFDNHMAGNDDAAFHDVVANGDGSFSLAGDTASSATGGSLSYFTARLKPIVDLIYANGFD